MSPNTSRAGNISAEEYIQAGLENLKATSRTASGTVDTTASKDKAASMSGVSGNQAAELAQENFEMALYTLYAHRYEDFAHPEQLREFVEEVAIGINTGIVKEGVLIRSHDSDKYPYTQVKNLETSMKEFYTSLHERLSKPAEDPIQLAAWVEYRIDLTDHFFADGCGKISKAISAWTLMRANHKLPKFPKERELLFAAAPTQAIDLIDSQEDAKQFARWLKFYKTLF
jgi:hypothetical protein